MSMFCGIPGDGSNAADVGRGRHGEQVRKRLQTHAASGEKRERHHDQANNVVDEEG